MNGLPNSVEDTSNKIIEALFIQALPQIKSVFRSLSIVTMIALFASVPIGEATAAVPTDPPAAVLNGRLADLDIVERDFLAVDKSYSAEGHAQAEALLAQIRNNAGRLSKAEFELALAQLATLADNGHTTVFVPAWLSRYNHLPVHVTVFSDGLYVTSAEKPYRQLIGSKVIAVEGRTLDELRAVFHRYMSGASGFRDGYLPIFVGSPELMNAAKIAPRGDRLSLTLKRHGRTVRLVLPAKPAGGALNTSYEVPSALLTLSSHIPDQRKPLYLRHPNALFQLEQLSPDTYYLQFRSNRGPTIQGFADRALNILQTARPRFIILDERLNPGGDTGSSRDLMQALGTIIGPKGRLFILTSGRTFSAGIASTGYAKQSAGDRATIIGEPVGDRLVFWAEGSPIDLPYSHVLIQPSPQRHSYTNGCPEPDCHKSVRQNPLFLRSLQPDVLAPLTYGDFLAGRDPSMEQAQRLIEQERGRD